jgi:nucleotidyltransferase/DNA polymerase involved in DNA repair
MFKTKGFSANSSLKRKAIIVDAPDLPPEDCEFFITSYGVADTEITDIPKSNSPVLNVEDVFEHETENTNEEKIDSSIPLTSVKGIGSGTAENLMVHGVRSIDDLIQADPVDLSKNVSGASERTVKEWQKNAKQLMSA